jgi:hypothetical protein
MVQTLNIILPARQEYPQLLWTIYSYIADIPQNMKWHIHVASNGADDKQHEWDNWLMHGLLARRGYITIHQFPEPTHPHLAIHKVTEKLDNDGLVMFSCAHIAIDRGTIGKMTKLASRKDVGIVHSPQLHMLDIPDATGRSKLYGYKDPIRRGWSWQRHGEFPYKWHSSSCALVCFKLSDWRDIGGENVPFCQGIGGCETLLDMKMWMFGKSVWVHPDCLYYHWAKTRNFTWTMGQHEWNQLVAFYCLGGREFMETMNLELSYPQKQEVLDKVQSECSEHRRFIIDNAKFSLQHVLEQKPWLQ